MGMVATSDKVLDVHIVSGDVMAGRQDFGLRSSTATTLADATLPSQPTRPMQLSASSASIGSSSIAQNTNERGTRVSAPKGNEQSMQSPVAQNPAARSLSSENKTSSQPADFEDIAKLRSQQRRIASIDSAFASLYD